MKAVARAIQEPNICKHLPRPIYQATPYGLGANHHLDIDISSITTQSKSTSAISRTAIGSSSDWICVTGTRNGTQPRAQRSAGEIP